MSTKSLRGSLGIKPTRQAAERKNQSMCVIIDMPPGKDLRRDVFDEAFRDNPDGWGIIVPASADGGYAVHRGMTFPEFEKVYEDLRGSEMSIHFRKKTHGAISIENCHPFQLLSLEKNGADAFLMHNGVIRDTQSIAGKNSASDTVEFVEGELIPILNTAGDKAADLLSNDVFLRWMEQRVTGSRLLISVAFGGIALRYHLGQWHEKDGMLFSNTTLFDVIDPPRHHRYGRARLNSWWDETRKRWIDGDDDNDDDVLGWPWHERRPSETRTVAQHINATERVLDLTRTSSTAGTGIAVFHPKPPRASNIVRPGQAVGGRNLDHSVANQGKSRRQKRREKRKAAGETDADRDEKVMAMTRLDRHPPGATHRVMAAMMNGEAFAPLDMIKADLLEVRHVMRAYPVLAGAAMAKSMVVMHSKLETLFQSRNGKAIIKAVMEQPPKEDALIAVARALQEEVGKEDEAIPS